MVQARRKHRTHVKAQLDENIPRSMVIKMGDAKREPTKSLAALVRDFRAMMGPHTAAKLRERKANKLKDYLVMAGPLGVSHFFLFSQSHSGNTTLRIGRTPRGPTLYFRVVEYSLARDIQKTQARPHALTHELRTPPLLVMNNFSADKTSDMEALLTSMLHNMLPSINVQSTKLSSITRVLLLNRDKETGDIELRHYAIVIKESGVSRAVKKLSAAQSGKKAVPNLQNAQDVADFLFDPGASESEGEDETFEASRDLPGAGSEQKDSKVRKAVRLVEVGPRLLLRLQKIEDGLCQGKTLFHSFQNRDAAEAQKQDKEHKKRDDLRAQRRKAQEERVKQKREEKSAKSTRSERGKSREQARQAASAGTSDGGPKDEELADSDTDFSMSDAADPETMNDYELDAELAASDSD